MTKSGKPTPAPGVVEMDAMDVHEWESGQRTPQASDANLAALVKQSAHASAPSREPAARPQFARTRPTSSRMAVPSAPPARTPAAPPARTSAAQPTASPRAPAPAAGTPRPASGMTGPARPRVPGAAPMSGAQVAQALTSAPAGRALPGVVPEAQSGQPLDAPGPRSRRQVSDDLVDTTPSPSPSPRLATTSHDAAPEDIAAFDDFSERTRVRPSGTPAQASAFAGPPSGSSPARPGVLATPAPVLREPAAASAAGAAASSNAAPHAGPASASQDRYASASSHAGPASASNDGYASASSHGGPASASQDGYAAASHGGPAAASHAGYASAASHGGPAAASHDGYAAAPGASLRTPFPAQLEGGALQYPLAVPEPTAPPMPEPVRRLTDERPRVARPRRVGLWIAGAAAAVAVAVVAAVLTSGGSSAPMASSSAPPTTVASAPPPRPPTAAPPRSTPPPASTATTAAATAPTTAAATAPTTAAATAPTTAAATAPTTAAAASPTTAAAASPPPEARPPATKPATTSVATSPAVAEPVAKPPVPARAERPAPADRQAVVRTPIVKPAVAKPGRRVALAASTRPARRPKKAKKLIAEDTPRSSAEVPSLVAQAEEDPAIARARGAYISGNDKLFAGDTTGAIAAYREALSIYPGYVGGYRGLGLAYAQRGDHKLALDAFKTYVTAVPAAKDVALIKKRIARLQHDGDRPPL